MNSLDIKGGGELIKGVGELIKSVGPTDEHRQAFGRTFFGTLLGQTVVLIGMLLAYFVAIVLLWKYAFEDLKALYSAVGDFWFWLIVAAPIICILLFSMLPTAWRTLRERRMKAAAIGGDAHFDAIHFRPYPYGEADREAFKRLDNADRTTLNWLKSTEASLLYLSGASGVGKSSLLAASVLPQLRDSGWTVIETRLFGDPIDGLRAALFASETRLVRKVDASLSLHDLLKKVADGRTKKGGAPLLLVIDQFEEFLILHRDDEDGGFAAFLSDLVKRPIDGVRLLIVFRSDYRPLIFKLDLPPLVAGQNWLELAPYDRGEAIAFLRSGGRELSSEAIDRLFRGLDRIEDAPGMYRLITLNMIGLVLERMGRTLEGDPGQLIQSYLTTCLTTSESRDFAKPLLAQLITEAGTKEPRSEAELAAITGFNSWQVKATLAELARHGLVRRLETATAIWEIAHDFLARIIGQLIGRLKPNILHRARGLVAPVVLLGWIALAILALPYWMTLQERAAEAALRQLGASFSGASGGIAINLSLKSHDDLIKARPHLGKVNLSRLVLSTGISPLDRGLAAGITSLEPLKGLTNLRSLDIDRPNRITSLEPLKGLTNLRSLTLGGGSYFMGATEPAGATGITSLEPLKGLTNLSSLRLDDATGIRSLEPLMGLTNLTQFYLSGATGIASLEPLKGLTNLGSLQLFGATGITSLEPLMGLTNLSSLHLRGAIGITSLEPLKGLTNFTQLDLSGATSITSWEPLKGLTNLGSLQLSGATGITSLEPLKGLTNLGSLQLSGATGITSLEPLMGLTNLTHLGLSGAIGITSLEPLKGLTNLGSLQLSGATGIASLEPLKGLTNLTHLYLSGATGITSLEPLKGLTNLRWLDLGGATGITSLEPLKGLTNLTQLGLSGATGITSLEPLKGLTNFTQLDLSGATGITSLEPLKQKTISISGASRELLATRE